MAVFSFSGSTERLIGWSINGCHLFQIGEATDALRCFDTILLPGAALWKSMTSSIHTVKDAAERSGAERSEEAGEEGALPG